MRSSAFFSDSGPAHQPRHHPTFHKLNEKGGVIFVISVLNKLSANGSGTFAKAAALCRAGTCQAMSLEKCFVSGRSREDWGGFGRLWFGKRFGDRGARRFLFGSGLGAVEESLPSTCLYTADQLQGKG